MRSIHFDPAAWEDFLFWVSSDRKMARRTTRLVGVTAVADGVDLDLVLRFIDSIDDAVRTTTRRIVPVKRLVQRLSRPVWIHCDRAIDRLHRCGGNLKWEMLTDITASLAGHAHVIRLALGRVHAHSPKRRRRSSSART